MPEGNDGAQFEEDVGALFRALGYDVTRDVSISGSQVDLVLRRRRSPFNEHFIVECKAHSSRIGVKVAREFASLLASVHTRLPGSRGILVSKSGVTSKAKEFLDSVGIQSLTLADLERNLFDLEPYLQSIIRSFDTSRTASHFIALDCFPSLEYMAATIAQQSGLLQTQALSTDDHELQTLVAAINNVFGGDHAGGISASPKARMELLEAIRRRLFREARRKHPAYARSSLGAVFRKALRTPIEDFLAKWLAKEESQGLLVLGGYGTGKTTILQKFAADQARRYLADTGSTWLPVFLSLRDFPDGLSETTLWSALSDLLTGGSSSRLAIQQAIADRRLLLLLDGFDEMGLQSEERRRRLIFSSILSLTQKGRIRIIVSGRPEYFRRGDDLRELIQFVTGPMDDDRGTVTVETVHLAPLSEDQIEQYLASHSWSRGEVAAIMQKIYAIYNLRELAERPFLLKLIVSTISTLSLGEEEEVVSPALLYKQYTEKWLSRDYSKGEFRWLIGRKEKLEFMKIVAWTMLSNGRLKVHYSELSHWVQKYFRLTSPATIDYLAHDVRTCSFLTRDDAGHYYFVHRSFMEYFVGVKIAEDFELEEDLSDALQALALPGITSNSLAFAVDLLWRSMGEMRKFVELLQAGNADCVRIRLTRDSLLSLPRRLKNLCAEYLRSETRDDPHWLEGQGRSTSFYTIGRVANEAAAREKDAMCSFCTKQESEVEKMVQGPTVQICSECVLEGTWKSWMMALEGLGEAQTKEVELSHRPEAEGLRCSFCNKAFREVKWFLEAVDGKEKICDECLDICVDIIEEKRSPPKATDRQE